MPALPSRLPVRMGGLTAGVFVASGIAYDVTIGGIPFLAAQTEQDPLLRETAPFTKDQQDASGEAGERSLQGWWWRAQSSFHGGAGLTYLEAPAGTDQTESRIRYDDSLNVDPWTPGVVRRLPDATIRIASGASGQKVAAGRMGTTDYVLHAAGSTLTTLNISSAGVVTTTTITWGGVGTILAVATDGRRYFVADNAGIWSGPVDNSVSPGVKIYTLVSPTSVVLGWVKQRLILALSDATTTANASVYELVAPGLALPTAKYTHPTVGWQWTSISESPSAVLISGFAGGTSGILAFELNTSGVVPTLTSGAEIARATPGEIIRSMYLHAGSFLAIGTSRGLRVGTFDQFAGRLQLGPLTLTLANPVLCAAGRGDFIFCGGTKAINGSVESGLMRVDPGTPVDQAGRLAWSTDLICDVAQTGDVAGVDVTASGRLVFAVDGYGLLLEGVGSGTGRDAWLRTARIRYSTAEPKVFKYGRITGSFATPGVVRVLLSSPGLAETTVLTWTGDSDPERFILLPGPRKYVALRFQLTGSAAVSLTDYQIQALPAVPRQRLLQFVLLCSDYEKDRNGAEVSKAGYAWDRLEALEALEDLGDEVNVQEFLPGIGTVTRRCIIDRVTYRQQHRPARTDGRSGIVLVVARTVS